MTRGQKRSLVRRGHRWLGLAAALLVLVTVGSGIALQHPRWLGGPNNEPLCLAVDPTDAGHILRGTHWGVEASGDGGKNWREVSMLAAPTDVKRILFLTGNSESGAMMICAMGRASVVVSEDGGRVWREISLPTGPEMLGAKLLDLTASGSGNLELLTSAGHYRQGEDGAWHFVGVRPPASRDWQRWMHDLHTGHVFGLVGRRTAEGGAWAMILLTVSGLILHGRLGNRRPR